MAKRKVFQIGTALTEGLVETISAARNYSGELRVEVIPLKKIEIDPENPRTLTLSFSDIQNNLSKVDPLYERKVREKASLQSMANSISRQGIINPIVVYKKGEKYRLVAGERRTLASLLAGKDDIQAKVLDEKPTELKLSLIQWIENIEREDLTLWERLRNLEKITLAYCVENKKVLQEITATDLSHLIGCSLPHAMNYKAIINADTNLKSLIKENRIKNLEKAALIANVTGDAVREKVMKACIDGATLKQLKVLINNEKLQSKAQDQQKKKLLNKKGRQATRVNFGSTKKVTVAKMMLHSILSHDKCKPLHAQFKNVDWNDYQSINVAFVQLVRMLENLAEDHL